MRGFLMVYTGEVVPSNGGVAHEQEDGLGCG